MTEGKRATLTSSQRTRVVVVAAEVSTASAAPLRFDLSTRANWLMRPRRTLVSGVVEVCTDWRIVTHDRKVECSVLSYYAERTVRNIGRKSGSLVAGGAPEILHKAARADMFDIFLSHSFSDADLILGVKEVLESTGKTVYVDWIHDTHLDRTSVNSGTAAVLRRRMRDCKALIYASTEAATSSKWMPWELGYFDGKGGSEHVAIMPLITTKSDPVLGQEYLGLYPSVQELYAVAPGEMQPFVTRTTDAGVLQAKSLSRLVSGSSAYTTVGTGHR